MKYQCAHRAAGSRSVFHLLVIFAMAAGPAVAGLERHPDPPMLVAPGDGAVGVALDPELRVALTHEDGDSMDVTFYGRAVSPPPEDFTIIHWSDTQFYAKFFPGTFNLLTQWITDNRESRNIVFAPMSGDCVEDADQLIQWDRADAAISSIEQSLSGMPDGIPYGISPGNHDEFPLNDPDGTENYNLYFGIPRFQGREYYGGNATGLDNDNHFALFSGGGMDFISVFFEFDDSPDSTVLAWADSLLSAHSERRALVVSHYLMNPGEQGSFGAQGQATYDALKDNANLFLMLCGHLIGEGKRVDMFEGNTLHTTIANYQGRPNGGDGWLRIIEFRPSANEIAFSTYSPLLDQFETDADSEFVLPYNMDPAPDFEVLGTVTDAMSGSDAFITWPGRDLDTEYEWYVEIVDSVSDVTIGPTWSFTTIDELVGIDDPELTPSPVLLGARPNPFRTTTTIEFELPATIQVQLGIYDASGRLVRHFLKGELSAGAHSVTWDGRLEGGDVAEPGIYFFRVRAGGINQTRKLLRLK